MLAQASLQVVLVDELQVLLPDCTSLKKKENGLSIFFNLNYPLSVFGKPECLLVGVGVFFAIELDKLAPERVERRIVDDSSRCGSH